MENEGTIIMVFIGFVTFLLTVITTVGGVIWQVGKINKSLSDSIKDLKLELIGQIRDRLHIARDDIGRNIQGIDERVDELERNEPLLIHRVEQIEKCLNSKSVCNLE